MSWPNEMLMVTPEHFDVEYAINPHMLDENGELNKVDKTLAQQQWVNLKEKFESLGMTVHTVSGQSNLPDMVFCANQCFPYIKDQKLGFILSQMHSEKRRPEVAFFKEWALANQIFIDESMDSNFEGMGDLLWNYETGQLFGGYGFRTQPHVYTEIERITDQKITTFELKDDRFYHLDTCLAILNGQTAAYVKEAFTPEGLATLEQNFENLIAVPLDEAQQYLACNMCTPNGKDVIIQKGAEITNGLLRAAGMTVHEVDTSEYIKSGGSVFCMKLLLNNKNQ